MFVELFLFNLLKIIAEIIMTSFFNFHCHALVGGINIKKQ